MIGELMKFFILGSLAMLTISAPSKNVCKSSQCIHTAEMFRNHMDTTFLPCQNFYDFMCGNFKKFHTPDQRKGRMSAFGIRERYVNQKILEFLNDSEFDNLPVVQKVRTFFKDCMDEDKIEQMGEATIPIELNIVGLPIKPPFNDALNKEYDFSRLLAKVHRHSVFAEFLFRVSVEPYADDFARNYLHFDHASSANQFRTDENPKEFEVFAFRSHFRNDEKIKRKKEAVEILKATIRDFVHYMNVLTNAPFSKKKNELTEARITELVDFFVEMNESTRLQDRPKAGRFGTGTKMTLTELQQKTDEIMGENNGKIKINWLDYIETLFEGIRDDARQIFENGEPIIIKNMNQLKAILKVVSQVNHKVFICALWWSVAQSVIVMSGTESRKIFYDRYSEMTKTKLAPRETRCLNITKKQYPFIFASALVLAEDNSFKDRKKVNEMVRHLREAFEDTITQSTWLDSSTKMAAINKLKFITQFVSFQTWMLNPFVWLTFYSQRQVVPGYFYYNSRSQMKTQRNGNLSRLGRLNNISMKLPLHNPADVNAGYLAEFNSIDIPIGILGSPFYNLGLEALNYGAIGIIIAHELGHALDNMGRGYDSWGRKRNWWKKSTDREYRRRAVCFVKSYSEIMIPTVQKKVNGEQTLGENIADFIGFTQALKAYKKYKEKHGEEDLLPHFEHYSHERLFTMAFANIYCEVSTPSYLEHRIQYDEHAPSQARILGVLQNSQEFAKIWDCTENSGMNPKEKCQLW